jgi:hypothetical protein
LLSETIGFRKPRAAKLEEERYAQERLRASPDCGSDRGRRLDRIFVTHGFRIRLRRRVRHPGLFAEPRHDDDAAGQQHHRDRRNTNKKKSTTALVATLTHRPQFKMVDGCSGAALGPGKQCRITITNTLASVPSADATATLTVAGKKAGSTSPKSVAFVVLGSGCSATNAATPYTDLQEAIDEASSGDTLEVRGMCLGNFTIDKDLILNGVAGAGTPTLDAQFSGVTLKIIGWVSVTLHSVKVTGGTGVGGAAIGAGIENAGNLTLSGSASVSENRPSVGGGITNEGTLTMNDSSSVSGNSVLAGVGIQNAEGATVIMNDSSSVTGNTSDSDGGGIANGGTLIMNDASSVWGNTARGEGGGILNLGALTGAVAGTNVYNNSPDNIVQFEP